MDVMYRWAERHEVSQDLDCGQISDESMQVVYWMKNECIVSIKKNRCW